MSTSPSSLSDSGRIIGFARALPSISSIGVLVGNLSPSNCRSPPSLRIRTTLTVPLLPSHHDFHRDGGHVAG